MSTEFPDERLELLFVSAHLAVDSATHKPFILQITSAGELGARSTRCYLRGLRDRLGSHTCYNS
jgi:predicted RNA polymerase sigma factor